MTDRQPGYGEEHPFFEGMLDQIRATPMPARRRLGWPYAGHVPRPGMRRLSLAGAGIGLAGLVAALVIALGAGGGDPAPAYGLTINANHTVTIYLRQLRAIGALNARLATLHVRIRAVPIVHGCVAPVREMIGAHRASLMHRAPGPVPGPPRTLEVDHISAAVPEPYERTFYFTMETSTLPGRTLILPVTRSGRLGDLAGIGDGIVLGRAPRCVGDDGLHTT